MLEYAVLRIEETVLAQHPHFKGCDITIEPKKIVILQGVRYEIDLLVTINPQTNYPAQHIIECKNWKAPVGTIEISSLAVKREAVQASSASLIAPAFTNFAHFANAPDGVKNLRQLVMGSALAGKFSVPNGELSPDIQTRIDAARSGYLYSTGRRDPNIEKIIDAQFKKG